MSCLGSQKLLPTGYLDQESVRPGVSLRTSEPPWTELRGEAQASVLPLAAYLCAHLIESVSLCMGGCVCSLCTAGCFLGPMVDAQSSWEARDSFFLGGGLFFFTYCFLFMNKLKEVPDGSGGSWVALLLLLLLLSHFSRVRLCATPETAAHQAPQSLGFSRQEHWSGLPFPSPMHESEVAQSCLTLSDPMDCSLPGSSVHGIFQTRVLEWGATAFSG